MKKRQATQEELDKFQGFLKDNNYSLEIEIVTSYREGVAYYTPNLVVNIVEEVSETTETKE